ncbi:unnamed protein product [Caenorhabditis angaria]|uniref:Uncharacterized protein n=1 Tax=Caenorhabditis angaria TaxID=860376 RepID=A0A9P1IKL6_9PELO|nr:unnamed protein product [Caenorhabditis angaria]
MGALRNIGHHIAISVRRLLKSPRGFSSKIRFDQGFGRDNQDLSTPDSSRSVSFTEAITWPFIDEDVDEETGLVLG